MALSSRDSSLRRAQRTRIRLRKLANGRPRLSVFRSSKNIYAQIIDDERGVTLAAASSLEGGEAKTKGTDRTPPPASAPWSPSAPWKRASRT
jgi:large subunit ribosomal protein L18